MTKEQAADAIKLISYDHEVPSWAVFKQRIREILDQIDPEPGEFSVRELCELMSPPTYVALWPDERCTIWPDRIQLETIDELKAKLIELATPPKPKTGIVELPIELINRMASWDDDYARAAKAALNKLEQQQPK